MNDMDARVDEIVRGLPPYIRETLDSQWVEFLSRIDPLTSQDPLLLRTTFVTAWLLGRASGLDLAASIQAAGRKATTER